MNIHTFELKNLIRKKLKKKKTIYKHSEITLLSKAWNCVQDKQKKKNIISKDMIVCIYFYSCNLYTLKYTAILQSLTIRKAVLYCKLSILMRFTKREKSWSRHM